MNQNNLTKIEKELEEDATLISEAISDVVTISKMNQEEIAEELIANQFIVINRQDAPELFSREQLIEKLSKLHDDLADRVVSSFCNFDVWIKENLK